MKLTFLLITVLCLASMVLAEEGTEEKMTDQEIQELINGYKDLTNNNGMSAPVSNEYLSLMRLAFLSL